MYPFLAMPLLRVSGLKKVGPAPNDAPLSELAVRRRSYFMQEDGKHYLFVKGQKVYVSDEIYRAYVRPERKERMRRYRIWRAKRITSVELLAENGYELEDKSPTVETALIEEEECSNELANLHAAIRSLM